MKPTWLGLVFILALLNPGRHAQAAVTSPKQFFGFNIGDDYRLANYKQFAAYLTKLETRIRSAQGGQDRRHGGRPRRSSWAS